MPRLTKRVVDSLAVREREYVVWDEHLPGFGVRVRPSGRKIYIVHTRLGGRQRKLTLGPHGVLTLDQARTHAQQCLAALALGEEPQRTASTVADLAQRYLAEHAIPHKKPSSVRPDRYNLRLHILPALGKRPVAQVTRAEIAAFHHGLRDTPGTANRCLSLLSKMFALAEQWGLRPDGTNPVRGVQRYREQRMERFLSQEELARLGTVLRQAEETQTERPSVLAAIRLLLFTGARVQEILRLRWDQVDLARGVAVLPDSKSGAKVLYLGQAAASLLQKLPQEPESPWVLPGKHPGKPLGNISRPWYRLRAQAGLDDVRLHDLRHTFASIGAAQGLSLVILGKALGHRHAATTQRYAHLSQDPVQAAVDQVAETVARALGG